jgi:hypothetical protein
VWKAEGMPDAGERLSGASKPVAMAKTLPSLFPVENQVLFANITASPPEMVS